MNADIFDALNRRIDGGPLDGLRFGDLVFGRDRDVRLLREIAAAGTDAAAQARERLDAWIEASMYLRELCELCDWTLAVAFAVQSANDGEDDL